jgi:hypothetical protein
MPPPAPAVSVFERTNFFYGLLMDAERFQKDHAFFNGKRWLLNRMTLGSGVVCGLDVRLLAGPPQVWLIDPGVAIDGAGREIVIAQGHAFDPAQLTDDTGEPAGPPLTTGTVEICLSYKEVPADLVPVLVPECDGQNECAPSTIREGFVVIVRRAGNAAGPSSCTLPEFPVPPGSGLHGALARRVRAACPPVPADMCVPIARVDVGTKAIDADAGRPLVYSNQLLYELIVCLAEHIAGAAARVLRYVSGDGQTGASGTALPKEITVQLVDAAGNPVAGETVLFTVTSGGGGVAAAAATTAADGRASTTWTLGPTGEQRAVASAQDTPFAVTFHATST